nr:MAG TPA: hypothetical protein [Caudoviricetes sp.]
MVHLCSISVDSLEPMEFLYINYRIIRFHCLQT